MAIRYIVEFLWFFIIWYIFPFWYAAPREIWQPWFGPCAEISYKSEIFLKPIQRFLFHSQSLLKVEEAKKL
jgi:hypothetical protein